MAGKSQKGQQHAPSRGSRHILKGFIPGTSLIIIGFAMLFILVYVLPMEQRTPLLFFFSIGVLMAGIVLLATLGYWVGTNYVAKGLVVPPNIMSSLQQIGSDDAFETEKFSVLRKGKVYVLLPKELFLGPYFIRLFNQSNVSRKQKVKLPFRRVTGIIWKGRFQDKINGLSIAKSRGEFTVPTGAAKPGQKSLLERYARGPGILYFIFRYDLEHVAIYWDGSIGIDSLIMRVRSHPEFDLSDRFETPTILKIMDKISGEKPKN
nr:hypothetical protein [Candidatus Njordarchaeota archaeon]